MVGEPFGLASHLVRLRTELFRERHEACGTRLERTSAAERVRLVRDAAAGDRLAVHPVTLVVVHLRDRCIDRNLVEVWPAQTRNLRIDVGVDAPREQRIVREVDARHHVRGAERDLLGFREEVVRISIEDELSYRHDGDQLLRDDLRGVEHVERKPFGLLLGEDLKAKLVFWKGAGFDCFP
jgi:hypothetical protein